MVSQAAQAKLNGVDFQTDPSRYRHWRLSFDGPVATLTMDVSEDGGLPAVAHAWVDLMAREVERTTRC
jgi:hypothetical protein